MWTSRSRKWYGTLDDTRRGEVLVENCSAKCVVTNDLCLLDFSDAVVFHLPDFRIWDLPPRRHSWQRWVFHMMETPKSIEYVDLNPVRDIFNWTMTYRSDSDVYVPYGRTVDHGTKPAATKRDMKALWKTKSRTAVWLISDCLSYSGRKTSVENSSSTWTSTFMVNAVRATFRRPELTPPMKHFERNYHFILTFEDSICAEYVTEKLFTALKYDIVPVVFGGANYSRIRTAPLLHRRLCFRIF
ncbi:alpha-(1,3)-fucosyltransferase C-like [Rhipicephalus sanguineus]|nr:alpha-(1,3)-fucosyltransferase C-like [Rhipicephalus sanguineus]